MDKIKNISTKTLGYGSLLALTTGAIFGGWQLIDQVNNIWILRAGVVVLAGFLVEQVVRLTRN